MAKCGGRFIQPVPRVPGSPKPDRRVPESLVPTAIGVPAREAHCESHQENEDNEVGEETGHGVSS